MSTWDEIDKKEGGAQRHEKQEFVKFPEGITRLRIIGEQPHIRWTHYMPQHKRSVNCPGMATCPICKLTAAQKKAGEKPTYNTQKRFAILVINRETNRIEILDQGKTFFEDLRDVRADNGDLSGYDIRVKRRGKGQDDTSYRIDKDAEWPLSAEDKKLIAESVDLEEYFKPHTPEVITRVINGEAFDDVMKETVKAEANAEESTSAEEYEVE